MILYEQTTANKELDNQILPVKRMISWIHAGWYAPRIYTSIDCKCSIMMYQYIGDVNMKESHAEMAAKENCLSLPEYFEQRPRTADKFLFII